MVTTIGPLAVNVTGASAKAMPLAGTAARANRTRLPRPTSFPFIPYRKSTTSRYMNTVTNAPMASARHPWPEVAVVLGAGRGSVAAVAIRAAVLAAME